MRSQVRFLLAPQHESFINLKRFTPTDKVSGIKTMIYGSLNISETSRSSELLRLSDSKTAYRYYAYARQALVEALRLANVLAGDEVLVPALICKDVLSSIHTVGANPVFYQVDKTLAPVSLPHTPLIKAVIAVNYFGFPQDLEIFSEYCHKFSVKLIEDNAHGYLSANVDGVLLGNRAPLGITSIRKTIRIPDGARLHVSDPQLSELLPYQLSFNDKPLGCKIFSSKHIFKS